MFWSGVYFSSGCSRGAAGSMVPYVPGIIALVHDTASVSLGSVHVNNFRRQYTWFARAVRRMGRGGYCLSEARRGGREESVLSARPSDGCTDSLAEPQRSRRGPSMTSWCVGFGGSVILTKEGPGGVGHPVRCEAEFQVRPRPLQVLRLLPQDDDFERIALRRMSFRVSGRNGLKSSQ